MSSQKLTIHILISQGILARLRWKMERNKNQLLGLVHKSVKNLCLAEKGYQGNCKGLSADFNSPEVVQTTFDKASLVCQSANIRNLF